MARRRIRVRALAITFQIIELFIDRGMNGPERSLPGWDARDLCLSEHLQNVCPPSDDLLDTSVLNERYLLLSFRSGDALLAG